MEQRKALICEFETLVLRCRDSQECERAAKDRQRQRGVTQEKDERAEMQDRRPKEVREKLPGRRSKGQGRHLTAPRHMPRDEIRKKSQIPLILPIVQFSPQNKRTTSFFSSSSASAKVLGRLGTSVLNLFGTRGFGGGISGLLTRRGRGVGRRVVDGWRCGLFVSFEGEGEGGCRGLIRGRDGGTFAAGRLKSIFQAVGLE